MLEMKEYIILPPLPSMPNETKGQGLGARLGWMLAEYKSGYVAMAKKIRADIAPSYNVEIIHEVGGSGGYKDKDSSCLVVKADAAGLAAIANLFPDAMIEQSGAAAAAIQSPRPTSRVLRLVK